MDLIDFEDETFVINLLRALRDHKSIKSLSLHVQGIQPSGLTETHLIKSLQNDHFIRRLCISASVISRKLTKALVYASKEFNTLKHLEFYNSYIKDEDKTQLQLLYDSERLIQLEFYEQERYNMMFDEASEQPYRGKTSTR
ncbi:unnamed protein product [Rotaria magnacalcarata]|uniref:Uncharacterized protein n=1 Tax=Rotaria magnacalcarata TaxID=392030 RepID=A0A816R153_9BILA|nr:unnamed protein product [Rotaria magnacalcarata]CAF4196280.1 unnamed protein product [Rotaria magnacalcarata]